MSQPAFSELAPPRDSELIFDDGEPLESEWHAQQLPFLAQVIHHAMTEQGRTDYCLGTNNFVYYSAVQAHEVIAEEAGHRKKKRAFRGPDVFWVGGVVDSERMREGWVAWHEDGKLPDVIVEVLSPSTAKKDRTEKKDLYEQVFGTAEYFLCDPDKKLLEGYRLIDERYRPIPPDLQGRLWSEQLGAAFGRWHGVNYRWETDWFRLFRADGSLVPTGEEMAAAAQRKLEAAVEQAQAASQEAVAAKQEAVAAKQEAVAAKQEAVAAQQEAEVEKRRAAAAEAELALLRAELQRGR